jgi:translation initiation factor IF-2
VAAAKSAPQPRKTKAQVHEPVLLKEFCSEVGVPFIRVMKTLQRQHGMTVNINTALPTDLAELLALEEGVELEVIKARTRLDLLHEDFENRPPKKPGPRPPVVTFLGHVDHGKTSLLDAIRATRVVSSEDGGITQHIGAYHIERDGVAVTFLDTPGHEAFTAMRARGAQLTDVVVLVVASDDGLMPQTIEAINHAKAAGVPIVVAITKMDLGEFNEAKVFGQLAEQELTPAGDWGGQTDVIKTSAVTGEGIEELLEHLTALAELLDLTADHAGDPMGAVIEAETREGVGAAVRVLVQRGRLRPGTVVACGNSCGKVRALLDDQGKRLKEAGPSMPCEIWGLDEVPSAGDRFYGVKTLQQAKSLADEVRQNRAQEARASTQKARTLEDMFKQRDAEGTPELNVIIRADVDGSVDALRHSLEQLPGDQVSLVIRHAGVGAVSDSDVHLADASDAIIIAFRVSSGLSPRKLAEETGVEIREYKVIYDVIDDVSKAMEGLLEPEEKLEPRATIEVRDVFKISKVGAVAGCYVTDGLVARDHRARLVREGTVIREDCRIASLRRFKDDVKEVRAGMECGIRLEDFDDVKRGDSIEAYEVVKVARKL